MAISRTPNTAVARRDEYERSQAEREKGYNVWHTFFAMRYSTAQERGIPDDELVDVEVECWSPHGRGVKIGEFLDGEIGFCPDKYCAEQLKRLAPRGA